MHDWEGSRVREDAKKVPCRYCHAPAGEPCATENGLLEAFPAHTMRLSDARKATGGHPYEDV